MTTYNIKSTVISNRDAIPKVFTDAYVSGGCNRASEGYVQTNGAADGAGSIYRMSTVPSNARIEAVKIQTDSLGAGCTLNVGVFWPTYIPVGSGLTASNASTAIWTNFFASGLAASSANTVTDVTNNSGLNTIKLQELPLWSAVGLASDPLTDLDICVEVAAAVATQGYIGLKVSYTK